MSFGHKPERRQDDDDDDDEQRWAEKKALRKNTPVGYVERLDEGVYSVAGAHHGSAFCSGGNHGSERGVNIDKRINDINNHCVCTNQLRTKGIV